MTEIRGKSILVRVSARFELARVRVIGSRLYFSPWLASLYSYCRPITPSRGLCDKRISNQMKNDPRSCERNLCNCVRSLKEKLGLQRDLNPWPCDPVRYSIQLSYEATDVGSWSQHHEWLHSSELVRASHQHREVTGSNRVEVLNFFSDVLRNCIIHSRILSTDFISACSPYMTYFIYIIDKRISSNVYRTFAHSSIVHALPIEIWSTWKAKRALKWSCKRSPISWNFSRQPRSFAGPHASLWRRGWRSLF